MNIVVAKRNGWQGQRISAVKPAAHAVGFTIVELLVVIGIIAILAGIGFPSYWRIMQNTRYNTCMENLREIGVALALYRADYGEYPPAPRPDYLAGLDANAMPFTKKPASPPAGWQEWKPDAGGIQYTLTPTASATDMQVGNFGLTTLYYLYLDEQRNYMRDAGRFHCPEMHSTEMINRASNVKTLGDTDHRAFDPLWAGYNTYSATYNYDQYNNEIIKFDANLGFADTATEQYNLPRQLKNPTPPGDTVVCWCYGHKTGQKTLNELTDPARLNDKAPATGLNDAEARALAQSQRDKVDLVLWVDGSVRAMRPYLMPSQQKAANGYPYYYWVQPYLYAAGESQ